MQHCGDAVPRKKKRKTLFHDSQSICQHPGTSISNTGQEGCIRFWWYVQRNWLPGSSPPCFPQNQKILTWYRQTGTPRQPPRSPGDSTSLRHYRFATTSTIIPSSRSLCVHLEHNTQLVHSCTIVRSWHMLECTACTPVHSWYQVPACTVVGRGHWQYAVHTLMLHQFWRG